LHNKLSLVFSFKNKAITSFSLTIKKKLGARQVPFGYSLSLTIIETKDERCLGTWVLQYTLRRCSNIHTWLLVSNDIKSQVRGTRRYHFFWAHWFALLLTHALVLISLIVFENAIHDNQT